jgi:hypothetical protein
MKIGGREKKLHAFGILFQVAVSARCSRHPEMIRSVAAAATCFMNGEETRPYQRAASRPGPKPFFNSQTRKAASSNLLVRPSVSTGARTMSSSSSITMRVACPTRRRDLAAENSVFRSFEVLFLFTIAVIHYGKLELYVLPDLFGRICTRLFFSKQFTVSSNKEKI